MLIAEALKQKKDLKEEIISLKERIKANSLIQDGQTPDEDPAELLSELARKSNEIIAITKVIEKANSNTTTSNGKTISNVLVEYEGLKTLKNFYDSLLNYVANRGSNRYYRGDIATLPSINTKELRAKSNELGAQIREIDSLIQTVNWSTEIVIEDK